jgi:hypothetical protein
MVNNNMLVSGAVTARTRAVRERMQQIMFTNRTTMKVTISRRLRILSSFCVLPAFVAM